MVTVLQKTKLNIYLCPKLFVYDKYMYIFQQGVHKLTKKVPVVKLPLPAPRTQRAPVQIYLCWLYFLCIINSAGTCVTGPPGAWMQDTSAAESRLQGEKEMVMVLTSKGRRTRIHLLPVLSSVCQFYGDNKIKWKQKSSHGDINTGKMAVKKSKSQRHWSGMPWEMLNSSSLLWREGIVDLRVFTF